MKNLHVEVNDDFPSAKVQAFKDLCLVEGDYKVKSGTGKKDNEVKWKSTGLMGSNG